LRAELLLRPQDSQLLLDLSNLLMDNGQRRAAVACLKRMVLARPDNVSGWQNLAIAQFMRGQYDDGIESCRRVLERDSKNLPTMFNLALAYEQLGRYDRALAWVMNGLAIEPRDPSFENLRFRLRMLKIVGRLRRAVRALRPWR
jgi:tetratricopeptide (TPR) repeat protein